jgi:GT2 family glycosyltransferase
MRHLDLREQMPSLALDPGLGGVYLVIWWHDIPLAHLELDATRLPLDAFALRQQVVRAIAPTVQAYLSERRDLDASVSSSGTFSTLLQDNLTLERVLAATTAEQRPTPAVTIVVCTRDRPTQLARCLDSLRGLTLSPAQLLVVDNAPSSPATRELVAARTGVDYVLEPEPGLDRARNTGVRHSRGEIVAFVDDDVSVHPEWLRRMLHGFAAPTVMAVTGLVLPAELETLSQYLFEKDWGFNRGYAPRLFAPSFQTDRRRCPAVWEIGAGASMAFRREAFERLGGFDQRLDAGAAGVAGDSEFWYRVLAAGFGCRYQPSAVVFHWHRRELRQLHEQIFGYMRGHVAALLIQQRRYGGSGNLRRLLSELPSFYADTALRAIRPKHRRRAMTLRSELAGCAAGVRYYLATRQHEASAVPVFGSALRDAQPESEQS